MLLDMFFVSSFQSGPGFYLKSQGGQSIRLRKVHPRHAVTGHGAFKFRPHGARWPTGSGRTS